jgi:hypothetical protein
MKHHNLGNQPTQMIPSAAAVSRRARQRASPLPQSGSAISPTDSTDSPTARHGDGATPRSRQSECECALPAQPAASPGRLSRCLNVRKRDGDDTLKTEN